MFVDFKPFFAADPRTWIITAPFTEAKQVFIGDTATHFILPIWSPDGEWLAFTQWLGEVRDDCTINYTSTLMISRADGTEMRKVSETFSDYNDCADGLIRFAAIKANAWSADLKWLAVDVLDEPYWLSVETSELIPLYSDQAVSELPEAQYPYIFRWKSYSSDGRYALIRVIEDPNMVWPTPNPKLLLLPFGNPEQVMWLTPPDEFLFSYDTGGAIGFNQLETAWSPDSNFIAFTDGSMEEERLWIVSTETNEWHIVAQIPSKNEVFQNFGTVDLSWSSDGRWIAWLGRYTSLEAPFTYYHALYFFDTKYGITEKSITITINDQELLETQFVGWTPDSSSDPYFTVWVDIPEGGLYLIDPENPTVMNLLVGYDQFTAALPVDVKEIKRFLSWQP